MHAKGFGLAVVTGTLATTIALAGCGGTAPSAANKTDDVPAKAATQEESAGQVVGGWQTYNDGASTCTDEEKDVFAKAMEDLDGVDYEPMCVLGTQVVSGRNYAFLARGTTVTAKPVTQWYVAVVYQDLSGNASLTSVEPVDLFAPKVADDAATGDVVGGWQISEDTDVVLEPQEARDAFGKAAETYEGTALQPLETLGTQVVSGTNYLVLCAGVPEGGSKPQLYLATVYASLDGNAQITDVNRFDLLGYMG